MPRYVRFLLGSLLFVVLFKITKEHIWIGIRSFVFPVNIFSERQNELLILLIVICSISFLFILQKYPLKIHFLIIAAPLFYVLFRTIFHVRQITVGAPATIEILSLFFLIGSVVCVVPLVRWIFLISEDPINEIAQVIFSVNFAYLSCVSLQAIFDAGPMYNSNRFYGLSNHPNQFAATLALLNTGALFFLIKSFIVQKRRMFSRILPILVILGNFGYIIATGSRTGIATIIAATTPFLAILFFRRPIATIAISCFVFSLIIAVFMFVSTTSFDVYRIFSTENTRGPIFAELWQGFIEYPIFGVPYVDTHTSNSYLMALANVGMVGIIPFFLFIILDFKFTFKIHNQGNTTQRGILETSFLTSTFFGVFALGFLDGFYLQVISFSQLFAVMFIIVRCCYIEFIFQRLSESRPVVRNNNRYLSDPKQAYGPKRNYET